MNEQENHHSAVADHDDLNTTPPNPAIEMPSSGNSVSGDWVMPKPVFRQSSGQSAARENKYSLAADFGNEDVTAVPSRPESWDDDASLSAEPTSPEIAGAQPELADILPYEPEVAEHISALAVEQDKKSSSGLLMFAIAATLVIGFIALLLTVVYYLFLRSAAT